MLVLWWVWGLGACVALAGFRVVRPEQAKGKAWVWWLCASALAVLWWVLLSVFILEQFGVSRMVERVFGLTEGGAEHRDRRPRG